MPNISALAAMPSAARLDELKRLCRRLRLLDADLALTLGLSNETIRLYMVGKNAIPNGVLITLTALDALPRQQAELLIDRHPRRLKCAERRAEARLAEHAERDAIEAEINARPPLSACQAGAR
jgi:hypothetical protein